MTPEKTSDELFLKFWDDYQKKVGKDAALKAWKKLSYNEQVIASEIARAYAAATPVLKFRPHPATYLNQKRFCDDLDALRQTNANDQSKMEKAKSVFSEAFNDKMKKIDESKRIDRGNNDARSLADHD